MKYHLANYTLCIHWQQLTTFQSQNHDPHLIKFNFYFCKYHNYMLKFKCNKLMQRKYKNEGTVNSADSEPAVTIRHWND